MDPNQNKDGQGGDANKIEKQFDHAFNTMLAIFRGPGAFKRQTVGNDTVAGLVDELLKEREEATAKTFKEKVSALIDKKIAFDKECKKAEEDYKKLILEKKKAFTSEIKDVLQLIGNAEELRKAYVSTLGEAKDALAEEDQQAQHVNPE